MGARLNAGTTETLMNIGKIPAIALAAAIAALCAPLAAALAADRLHDDLLTLHDRSWLCATPEDYDFALERVRAAGGVEAARAELLAGKKCILIVEDDIEDIMAPFVEVTGREGAAVQVRFTVEFYKRIELLHRNITRATFVGWTGEDNLRNYHQWLTGKPQG